MRRIISKAEQKKKERIKQLVVGGILIIIMFASVLGYAFQSTGNEQETKVEYNDLEFVKKGDYWVLENTFTFRHNPLETENFYSEEFVNLLTDYESQPLYIYSEIKEAETEFYKNLYNYVQRIQYACLEDEKLECDETWPMKTCEDNFIIIQEGEFEIKQDNNCLFVRGTQGNLTKISDEVLFKILGIK